MKNARMKLRKWNSNDQTLMKKTWEGKALRLASSSPGRQFQNPFVKIFRDTMGCCHDYFTIDVKGLLQLDVKTHHKELCFQSAGKYTRSSWVLVTYD
ncbi:hypothetical protein TNCV_3977071 [Trichonephila clavipes]|nr:hypothetical protein TNCV_3977071 [Trichonephila clavipes]